MFFSDFLPFGLLHIRHAFLNLAKVDERKTSIKKDLRREQAELKA